MILFALTSDIKQSIDYADLTVCFTAFPTVDNKCLEQLYQDLRTLCLAVLALSVLKNHHECEDVLHDCTLLYGREQKAMFPGENRWHGL